MRQFALILISLIGVSLLTACPAKDVPSAPAKVTSKVTFVKGDPHALIAGATLNATSPLTTANASSWNGIFYLNYIGQFVEKAEVVKTSATSIEDENETKEANHVVLASTQLQLTQTAGTRWHMTLPKGLSLDFAAMSDGELQPVTINMNGQSRSLNLLHWSTSADGNTVSMLTETTDPTAGRALMTFYFEKAAPVANERHVDKALIYGAGPGWAIPWAEPTLDIHVCGSRALDPIAQNAVALWQKSLVGRLTLNYAFRETYPPFSDLNEHCIYVVDAYLDDSRENYFTFGQTHSIISDQRQVFVDSDTFIWSAEWQKMYSFILNDGQTLDDADQRRDQLMPLVVLHEIGHILGLGHKFKGPKSVMSYKYDAAAPTDYDIRALQTLYPLRQ